LLVALAARREESVKCLIGLAGVAVELVEWRLEFCRWRQPIEHFGYLASMHHVPDLAIQPFVGSVVHFDKMDNLG
jgi:hypothetical protein